MPDASRTILELGVNRMLLLYITSHDYYPLNTWMLTQSPGVKHLLCVCRFWRFAFQLHKKAGAFGAMQMSGVLQSHRRHTLRTISSAVVWALGFWLLVGCSAFVKRFKRSSLPSLVGRRPHVNINENYWMQASVFLALEVCTGMRKDWMQSVIVIEPKPKINSVSFYFLCERVHPGAKCKMQNWLILTRNVSAHF